MRRTPANITSALRKHFHDAECIGLWICLSVMTAGEYQSPGEYAVSGGCACEAPVIYDCRSITQIPASFF